MRISILNIYERATMGRVSINFCFWIKISGWILPAIGSNYEVILHANQTDMFIIRWKIESAVFNAVFSPVNNDNCLNAIYELIGKNIHVFARASGKFN